MKNTGFLPSDSSRFFIEIIVAPVVKMNDEETSLIDGLELITEHSGTL